MNDVPTILIIDNDDGLVSVIEARLESCGYTCITAKSGAQGIAAFREQAIDLVITDINMPAGNGVTLINALRHTSTVPVIVVTGFRDQFRHELRAFRDVTVIEKPFDGNDLIDLVDSILVAREHSAPRHDAQ